MMKIYMGDYIKIKTWDYLTTEFQTGEELNGEYILIRNIKFF